MNKLTLLSGGVVALSLLLSACGGGGGGQTPGTDAAPVTTLTFDVTVTNLTNAQPLSPVAYVGHDGTFRVFSVGGAASPGLELLAEAGDNSMFLSEADANDVVVLSRSGSGPIGPGANETQSFTVNEATASNLSFAIATMLVNTNDGFTATNNVDVSNLMVGESVRLRTIVYDAGTEADTEGPGTIPGPADGGEGFNVARDDEADRVSMHPGVVTNATGLATSVLTEQHRFDNPAMQIVITRTN